MAYWPGRGLFRADRSWRWRDEEEYAAQTGHPLYWDAEWAAQIGHDGGAVPQRTAGWDRPRAV